MQLKVLLSAITPRAVIGPRDREVESIAYDSRRVQRNGLFVALRGQKSDGHNFIEQAIEKGAAVIVSEREISSARATSVLVENTRPVLADLSAAFFGNPSRRLKMAAVTGTNGKTTTTFLIKHICERAGLPCGLIGTVRYEIGERILPAVRTTPEALEVQELLAQMVNAGCRAGVIEVSSHALELERTRGIDWDVAVFTNLTQDHLDFHGTMENYFEAKAKLFDSLAQKEHATGHPERSRALPSRQVEGESRDPSTSLRSAHDDRRKKSAIAVINIDDRYGQKLVERLRDKGPVVTYGMSLRADFRASNYRTEATGTSYQLDAKGRSYLVRVPLIGRFNVANSIAAIAASNALGIQLRDAVLSLARSPQVPGRLEIVAAKRQFQVFVDYAHSPDALLNVLKTLRELQPRKVIVVFGCGGNRDRQKRPLMGRVADEFADHAIITSDNPRKEDPDAIIAEVEQGFRSKHYEKIADRTEAIARAMSLAQPRDVVLIAGKGHETYQEFADHTIPFDDVQVAMRALENQPVQFS